jgi:Haem-degrading
VPRSGLTRPAKCPSRNYRCGGWCDIDTVSFQVIVDHVSQDVRGEWSFGKDGNPALALIPGVVAVAGGLPIKAADGTSIRAIGVSGDTPPPIDEQCAQAGLDAAKDMRK